MTTTEPPRRSAVAAGMAAARERGVRLGRPPAPLTAALRAAQLRDEGLSLAAIAATLTAEQVPTPSGRGAWGKSSVKHVLSRFDEQQPAGE